MRRICVNLLNGHRLLKNIKSYESFPYMELYQGYGVALGAMKESISLNVIRLQFPV